jgi:hypothetical protein
MNHDDYGMMYNGLPSMQVLVRSNLKNGNSDFNHSIYSRIKNLNVLNIFSHYGSSYGSGPELLGGKAFESVLGNPQHFLRARAGAGAISENICGRGRHFEQISAGAGVCGGLTSNLLRARAGAGATSQKSCEGFPTLI